MFGDAQLYISYERAEATLDNVYDYLHSKNYLSGFKKFIDDLTSHNVESYSLDFNKNDDINKMLDYIDDTLNERNYFSKKELEINEDTALYFITSLYFDNEWNSKYREDNNYDAEFNNLNGNNVTREYMRHTIQYPIYIYDKYVSVYDYYKNNMKKHIIILTFTIILCTISIIYNLKKIKPTSVTTKEVTESFNYQYTIKDYKGRIAIFKYGKIGIFKSI